MIGGGSSSQAEPDTRRRRGSDGTQKVDTLMHSPHIGRVRRSLAAALAAGTLLLVSACAGDDLAEEGDDTDATTQDAGSGPVRISGQNFPEAELVAGMYSLLLEDAGYEPEVSLVDTRDVYMATFPGDVDVVP